MKLAPRAERRARRKIAKDKETSWLKKRQRR